MQQSDYENKLDKSPQRGHMNMFEGSKARTS